MKAISTLYFRVSVKKRPFSGEEISLIISASDHTKTSVSGKLTLGKTLYFREMPPKTEQNDIDLNIVDMTLKNNFSDYQVV